MTCEECGAAVALTDATNRCSACRVKAGLPASWPRPRIGSPSPGEQLEMLRQRVAELEAACRCGAQALRMHDVASPTAVELEAAAEGRPSVYHASEPGTALREAAAHEAGRFQLFTVLRDELRAAHICLACGAHTPGRNCQCEDDE